MYIQHIEVLHLKRGSVMLKQSDIKLKRYNERITEDIGFSIEIEIYKQK